MAEFYLNGTVERDHGTFIPVASPVSNGNRFYLLTQFVPEADQILTVLNFSDFLTRTLTKRRKFPPSDTQINLNKGYNVGWF